MMLLGRKEQRVVRYILIPGMLLLIGVAVYFIGGRQVINMICSDMEYAVVQGEQGELQAVDSENIVPVKADGDIDSGDWIAPAAGKQYGEINCEAIELSVPLYYDDTYDILELGAGQSVLSYFPGQGGTILVGGHDTTFFAPLEKMDKGMEVKVNTSYGLYTYEVNDIQIITGSRFNIASAKEQLVLYTCYPYGDILSDRTQKIIYICDKTSGPDIKNNNVGSAESPDSEPENGGGADEQ